MTPIKRYFLYLKYYHELSHKQVSAICLPYQKEWVKSTKTKDITVIQAYANGFASVYRRNYAKNKMSQLH